jgi:hypothetical protein
MKEGQKAVIKISAILKNTLTNTSSEIILPSGRDKSLFLKDTDSTHVGNGFEQRQRCKPTLKD